MDEVIKIFGNEMGKMTVYIIIGIFICALLGLAVKIAEIKITKWAENKAKAIKQKHSEQKNAEGNEK